MQVRHGLEGHLLEALVELAPQRHVAVQPEVVRLPLRAQLLGRGRSLLAPGGGERALLAPEPVEGRLVEQIPRELVYDENAARLEQACDLLERRVEIADVMEEYAATTAS